ncbi:hypothetical protein [Tardiphaga sp.]|uniref:hypothetical protein n=1 Tax=Tardiphaga sp. TaxID=1926292 RepID=UPI002639290B|nr:hypothetical protein [Tardiphaga sp.]
MRKNFTEAVILRSERSEPRRTAAARAEHASFEARKRLHLMMTVECVVGPKGIA